MAIKVGAAEHTNFLVGAEAFKNVFLILVFDGNKSDRIGEMKEIWRLIFEVRYF